MLCGVDACTETLSALNAFDRREGREGVVDLIDGVSFRVEELLVENLRSDMVGLNENKGLGGTQQEEEQ